MHTICKTADRKRNADGGQPCAADVAHGLAVCEVGGTLTGGLLLLLLGPVATAVAAAALHLAAWLAGATLLRRFRWDFATWQRQSGSLLFAWLSRQYAA